MDGNGMSVRLEPTRSPDVCLSEQDLFAVYCRLSLDVRAHPEHLSLYTWVLRRILAPYTEDAGELVVFDNSSKAYFEMEGKAFTNFGTVLLAVIQIHFPDRIEHELEMLIWGKTLPPRIIRVDAKRLKSSGWLDDLGPQFICERRKIGNLQTLMQAMSQYAPVRDEYLYSGWVLDGTNIYVMDGIQLCGDEWDADKAKESCAHTVDMLGVAPHSLTIPLLAIALLSLVHSRMVDNGTFFKGVCCLLAPTQSFKTTLASLFFDLANGREAILTTDKMCRMT